MIANNKYFESLTLKNSYTPAEKTRYSFSIINLNVVELNGNVGNQPDYR